MTESTLSIQMADIEASASEYAQARSELTQRVEALQAELDKIRVAHMPGIKVALRQCADRYGCLHNQLEARPDLFERPKSQTVDGIRFGYRKEKGKVEFGDEAKVIDRIRKQLPRNQAELLIRVKESLDKQGLATLTADDLKRIGVRIADDDEVIFIKPTDSNVDKLVKALLDDAETTEGEP